MFPLWVSSDAEIMVKPSDHARYEFAEFRNSPIPANFIMPKQHPAMGTCAICGKSEIRNKLHAGASIRHNIFHLIALDYPNFSEASYICHDDLATYRGRYIQSLLVSEKGELTTH